MKNLFRHFYFWILIGILVGIILGIYQPETAVALKPLGDGFISLIKMLIGPIIFCTVVLGIVGAGDMKRVGRVGGKALIYFEVVSTLALFVGLVVVNLLQPGHGLNVDPQSLDYRAVADYAQKGQQQSFVEFALNIIPKTFFEAFSGSGHMLQILVLSILFGYAMMKMGKKGQQIHYFIEELSHIFLAMMNVVMKLAPLGAGGAMAFTVGKFGVSALKPLVTLMADFYLTCFIFVFGILGAISLMIGFNIFKFIKYIRHEILLVLATSSSESALPLLIHKLEKLGCSKEVVGLVVPSGYSFNLDGTNIYLTMAILFIAQALNIDLSIQEQLSLIGVAMLTSKGASGVTGAGFITLAATLAVVPKIPVAGLALILGIDRFMSEARSVTNFIGNGVAALFVARWEEALDKNRMRQELESVNS